MLNYLFKLLQIGSFLLLLLALAASAQQPENFLTAVTKPEFNTSDLQPTERMLVSYSKTIKSLNDVRTSDNILIYPEQIINAQHTVADLISQSDGVNLNGQGGLFQSYNIRGFSRARIKTEVDGIPIITDRRAGNSVSFIPAELISEVYIQKGPQSTLYGSDAMGGVVSISTQTHQNSAISFSAQQQDNARHISGNFVGEQVNASLVQRQADNANSASGSNTTPLNTSYQQKAATLSGATNWRNIDIFASAILSQGSDIGKSAITFPNKRISNYPQDDHLLSQIEFSVAQAWKLKLYQHNQQWQTDIARLDNKQNITRKNLTSYQSDTFGAYASWLVDKTVIGAEWLGRHNIEISEQEYTANNELVWQKDMINADEDTFAIYTLHDWYFNNLTISTGARYDTITLKQYQQEKSDNFLSLSTHFSYQFSPKTNLSLQVANAFRFPTVSELFFSGETPRGNTQGNSELKAETSLGWQLSIAHNINKNIAITFNSYHYTIDDFIERYTQDSVRYYRNNQKVKIQGFELSSQWQINQQWQSNLGFQWQQSQDETGNTVDDGIPKAIKWAISWQNDNINIRQQLNYQFSKQDIGPSEIAQESELIWHTQLEYQVNKNLMFSLSVINLTNNAYKSSIDEDAAYQPERSINVSGTWQF